MSKKKGFKELEKKILQKKQEAAADDSANVFSDLPDNSLETAEKAVQAEESVNGTIYTEEENKQMAEDTEAMDKDYKEIYRPGNLDLVLLREMYKNILGALYTLVRIHGHKGRMAGEFAYFGKYYIIPAYMDGVQGFKLGILSEGVIFDTTVDQIDDNVTKGISAFLAKEIL